MWSYSLTGTYYWSTLCDENGRVFALNFDGLLRAFDATTAGGAGSSGTAYAVSAENGNVLWTAL